jgi:hypothetical protein
MTNYEIIRQEAINNGIYTEEQIEDLEMQMLDLPIHTFAFWKKNGCFVKKGEKACITTRLWKFKKGKSKEEKDEAELAIDPADDPSHYYLTKAFLFHVSQVERAGV